MDALETDRLRLRRWRMEDREPFARLNADPRVMEFQPSVLSREQSDSFADHIEAHFLEHGFTLYAVDLRAEAGAGERFVGFIGLHVPKFDAPFMPCVEIGWRLVADVWGRGLATEGGRAVLRHSFEQLGLEEIVSFTAEINTRSERVMLKIGMKRDLGADFDHPRLPEGHPLRRHVLYRLTGKDWRQL